MEPRTHFRDGNIERRKSIDRKLNKLIDNGRIFSTVLAYNGHREGLSMISISHILSLRWMNNFTMIYT